MNFIVFWGLIALMTLVALFIISRPLIKERWVTLLILIAFPIVSILLYLHLGGSQSLQHYWALKRESKIVKAELAKIKNPQQIINQLKNHLNLHPDSPKGWYLLGRLYLGEQQFAKARQAFWKAYHLKPEDVEYAVALAQASFFNNHRRLDPKSLGILKDVLKRQPNNTAALNLLAINAYLRKDYKRAVRYWEQMLPMFPSGSRDSMALLGMIARAQKRVSGG